MYWDDFAALIRRNAAPYSAIDFHILRHGPGDVVSIMDYSLPRRELDNANTANEEFNWYVSSFVCNAGWVGGEIPMSNIQGELVTDDITGVATWKPRPAVGVRATLYQLLHTGVIWPSKELDMLLNESSAALCPRKYGWHA